MLVFSSISGFFPEIPNSTSAKPIESASVLRGRMMPHLRCFLFIEASVYPTEMLRITVGLRIYRPETGLAYTHEKVTTIYFIYDLLFYLHYSPRTLVVDKASRKWWRKRTRVR